MIVARGAACGFRVGPPCYSGLAFLLREEFYKLNTILKGVSAAWITRLQREEQPGVVGITMVGNIILSENRPEGRHSKGKYNGG